MKRRRQLSGEETRLWVAIARSARPLKGKTAPEMPPAPEVPAPAPPPPPPPGKARATAVWTAPVLPETPARRTPALPVLHPIERPVRRKIGKGRVALDDRIDLHGQTEAVAHGTLLFFLRGAQARGHRHVLVITGRGASFGSTGTLKRAMPHWFSTPEFRRLVAGFEPAERGHGGEGAFYVRVRRP
ncbi:Smr/MutS family protein [Aureimonas pseudogalii]|uniref:DNA-nicking Smr family endonuclease n=1 Tax=Aureimonas pseudogalii TaxID=1744844 RepID=A0A7W6EB27_9HYPH|nr:Smr/MutS family protein [Aureimonas pseudogalii]MBB3997569.1 DNA-nicking Smr family endonuclease [Aureimonas pseudogalii]